MTIERPIDDFSRHASGQPIWPDPLSWDKRIRNLSDRVAQLELEIDKLKGNERDTKRIVPRIFRFGGWK